MLSPKEQNIESIIADVCEVQRLVVMKFVGRLQALEPTWITSRQIEASRRAITRYTKRGASLWIRIFPDKTVTARAAESRMGSGKGSVDYWVAVVKPGTVILEISAIPKKLLELR
jgi:ribosomal protein L16